MSTPIDVTVTNAPNGAPHALGNADALSRPYLIFPPFPAPPPGVSITPFKAFKPSGIEINLDPRPDDVEHDGLGVPTLELRVKHELTEAEQRRRRRPRAPLVDAGGRRPVWYEEWAVVEHQRRTTTPIDPSLSRVDRLHQASQDFKAGRTWPPLPSGVQQLWDAFRLYIGIISNIQPPMSRKRAAMFHAAVADAEAEADSEDDDEAEDGAKPPPRERRVALIDEDLARAVQEQRFVDRRPPDTEERQARREYFREAKDQRMDAFFNDTERDIRVFFSAYFRDKGLMWSEQRTRDGPILVGFFLNFLLRNRVLPEPEHERGLRRGLVVVEQARTELPATFTVARALPDKFSDGCRALWGSMTARLNWANIAEDDAKQTQGDEPDAKRRKLDGKEETEDERVLREAAGGADIEVLTPDVVMNIAQEIESENRKKEKESVENADAAADNAGWGAPADDAWGAADTEPWGGTGEGEGAYNFAPPTADTWDIGPQPNQIMAFFGPTLFPLTHTTGIIERATRRIVRVTAPEKTKAKKKKGRSAAELIEEELTRRLARMVLEPWSGHELHKNSEITEPIILPDSRGAVVSESAETAGNSASAVHNPSKDQITVLIDPSIADKMVVGMGLGATWVQLARQDLTAAPDASEADEKNKKGGWGEAGQPTPYWYMEQLVSVLPSFHTEQ
ncbi:hypothetical protein BKA93DRAFT_821530 [Sparassis latifolia]